MASAPGFAASTDDLAAKIRADPGEQIQGLLRGLRGHNAETLWAYVRGLAGSRAYDALALLAHGLCVAEANVAETPEMARLALTLIAQYAPRDRAAAMTTGVLVRMCADTSRVGGPAASQLPVLHDWVEACCTADARHILVAVVGEVARKLDCDAGGSNPATIRFLLGVYEKCVRRGVCDAALDVLLRLGAAIEICAEGNHAEAVRLLREIMDVTWATPEAVSGKFWTHVERAFRETEVGEVRMARPGMEPCLVLSTDGRVLHSPSDIRMNAKLDADPVDPQYLRYRIPHDVPRFERTLARLGKTADDWKVTAVRSQAYGCFEDNYFNFSMIDEEGVTSCCFTYPRNELRRAYPSFLALFMYCWMKGCEEQGSVSLRGALSRPQEKLADEVNA